MFQPLELSGTQPKTKNTKDIFTKTVMPKLKTQKSIRKTQKNQKNQKNHNFQAHGAAPLAIAIVSENLGFFGFFGFFGFSYGNLGFWDPTQAFLLVFLW